MSVPFVHLRLHTEYALVDGLVRVKPLCSRVAKMGMPAVAVTDPMNFFGLIKFYNAAQGAGLKPILGCDLRVWDNLESGTPFVLTALVRDETGYRHLTELISRGYTQGQHLGHAYVRSDWVAEKAEGLILLVGKHSDVGQSLQGGRREQALEQLRHWQALLPDAVYLELQRTGRAGDEDFVHAAVELAAAADCPVVATNDVRFLERGHFEAHEVRVCISEGRTLDDPRRPRNYSEEQYLKTPEEMAELFADIPEALENTVEIARRCSVELRLGKHFLPNYPVPEGLTMDEFFRKISHEGLEERLQKLLDPAAADYAERRQVYIDRLDFELDIIIQMGFPGYFLIVMDFIKWAKNNGCPVGPGRGSGAGSLVAYVLKITDLDPLAYDLLFERFLNPERVSMPDFDVDFCMDNRDRVIQYVAEAYGREAVSQIVTFGSMAAKAVVRDVARVQGKSYGLADKLSKMIPFEVGMTLEKAYEVEEPLREFLANDEEAQEIWDMARQLEGLTRNTGKHAGGVVIAPTKLTDFAPLACDETGQGLVTQFDKDDVEKAGLVKFDFLGLRTLTIIDWAKAIIDRQRARQGSEPLDIELIPLDDKPTYDLLKSAETTAVFQLESRGMKELIKKLQPDVFEDIIALVALFRPGPLQSGMVDDFVNRKHGRAAITYDHPWLEPVLKNTYGVIVYQEQVMQIAQVLAGYTLGGADMLRRAMGKKKPEEMAKQREIFLEGATGKGIDPNLAGSIFDLMEKFAEYGFNKSHSAAYALVSYHTAYLKAHYPAPFMAAVLSSEMDKTDKVVTFIEECRAMGLKLTPPDVNNGEFMFTVDDRNRVVYGLGAIKGLGEGPVQSIIEARQQGGSFRDLFDFCTRVDPRKVNKRALEALVRSGALDSLAPESDDPGYGRAVMWAAMGAAVQAAEQRASNQSAGMMDLFGDVLPAPGAEVDVYADYLSTRAWTLADRLKGEKETLGLYLTGHPIDEYEAEIRQFVRCRISDLQPTGRESATIAGLVVAQRVMKNKKGDTMAFITLDDRSGRIEVSLFADVYNEVRELLTSETVLVVEGGVAHDDFSGGMRMRVRKVTGLTQARESRCSGLLISVDFGRFSPEWNRRLESALASARGGSCPVLVDYSRAEASGRLKLGEGWNVRPSEALLIQLRELAGAQGVSLLYN